MLFNVLFFLLSFLHSHARRVPDEERWSLKYLSNTNVGEFERVITGYDFDKESFAEEIPFNVCYRQNILDEVTPLHNLSGYVYCTDIKKGIKEMCPPGTEALYVSNEMHGCVNKTTNTSVLPIGSRCASQPCQNGGICLDFTSADGYICKCPLPYRGLHCHLLDKPCPRSACGGTIGKIVPTCGRYTTDMALDYICYCYDWNTWPTGLSYALTNCYTDRLFARKCEGKLQVGALPFTNKGFYICPTGTDLYIYSCALRHVWNDTQKECVLENN